MAKIDREFPNPIGLERAKASIVPILEKLQADYSKFITKVDWNEDKTAASMTGNGISGSFSIAEDKIHVILDLGFGLSLFKGKIEEEIANKVNAIGKDDAANA